ncbi:MAG: AraC family transcriptional regulator [Clostridiaceae bacterium]|nr:AraC family transcriptional regulator [Clostridiaceae bacterium]
MSVDQISDAGATPLPSAWDEPAGLAAPLLMQPIQYNDLLITFLEVIGARHSKDWVAGSHRHPWYEFNYLSEGSFITVMEGRTFLTSQGSFFLIPPGVVHSHRHDGHKGDDGFCVRWQLAEATGGAAAFCRPVAETIIHDLSVCRPCSVMFAADQLFADLTGQSPAEMETTFIHWLTAVRRALCPDSQSQKPGIILSAHRKLVEQVLLYLDAYSAKTLQVNELADSIGFSYRHLARIFRQETGSTIVGKLNSIRMNKAIDLLIRTDLPIETISDLTGFATVSYFSTLFKNTTHLQPSQYRKAHRPSLT